MRPPVSKVKPVTAEDIQAIITRRKETAALVEAGEDPEVAKVITDPANKKIYHHLENMSWAEIKKGLQDKWWRMNNLYYIIDKQGRKVLFKPNTSQHKLWNNTWYRTIILKARQRGFTTFIDLYLLDEALFNSNVECGVIAHNLDDGRKIFRRKIKFPYDSLPQSLRDRITLSKASESELIFSNGSSIAVSVSLRSATAQYLHISEFGKICAKFPEKAREIVTGALEAVAKGQMVFIESTAEGRSGYFYDYCKIAEDLQKAGKKLSPLDFRFFFSPWWEDPEYCMSPDDYVPIPQSAAEYFKELESKIGRALSIGQKSWWVKKHAILSDDMMREYPATPEEAFLAVVQGAYFGSEFTRIRKEKRICSVPYNPACLVDTWWDLGMNDVMAIWFTQDVGRELHCIDYYECSGEGFGYYSRILQKKGYRYGRHHTPHDIVVRELGTGMSRMKSAREYGLKFEKVERVKNKQDSIEAARRILGICWFDEVKCEKGIAHLENYRKEWDPHNGTYKSHPLHNEASNCSDAFQTLGMGHQTHRQVVHATATTAPSPGGWT